LLPRRRASPPRQARFQALRGLFDFPDGVVLYSDVQPLLALMTIAFAAPFHVTPKLNVCPMSLDQCSVCRTLEILARLPVFVLIGAGYAYITASFHINNFILFWVITPSPSVVMKFFFTYEKIAPQNETTG
jgi:hypothetical protein